MAAALRLIDLDEADRSLYGYDTFSGMTPPTAEDGARQIQRWGRGLPQDQRPEHLAPGTSRESVAQLLASTGYEEDLIHLVDGPFEETDPGNGAGSDRPAPSGHRLLPVHPP